ncbi:MAG: hypothetical protein H7Z75_10920 [Ferruginibacter sp.]|nr:hypothetical protein [Cytophagales bacterium]
MKRDYRGHRRLQQRFRASQRALTDFFELGIALIADENTASRRLRIQKLGPKVVGNLFFRGTGYAVLVFPVC